MTDTNTPAISILLPTYNGERYLAEQLDSILAQSFADFELLIIDDGSTDATGDISADFARRDDRIMIIPSKGNHGQKQRLIELLSSARAPLIAISDQDDIWHALKLERLMASLGDAALAFGRSDLIDEDGNSLNRTLLDVNRANRKSGTNLAILFRPQVSGHAMLARRDVLTVDAFRAAHPYDWLISLTAEFSRGIIYEDSAVVQHRIHGANAHNGAVLARLNLLRVRANDVRQALKRVRGRRLRLVEGLEFLSASPLVPESHRALFRDLSRQCRTAWNRAGGDKIVGKTSLRRSLLDGLRPLAASESDWQIVVHHVTALTLGLFHPLTLIRLNRLL